MTLLHKRLVHLLAAERFGHQDQAHTAERLCVPRNGQRCVDAIVKKLLWSRLEERTEFTCMLAGILLVDEHHLCLSLTCEPDIVHKFGR